jgi:hypothetical protein
MAAVWAGNGMLLVGRVSHHRPGGGCHNVAALWIPAKRVWQRLSPSREQGGFASMCVEGHPNPVLTGRRVIIGGLASGIYTPGTGRWRRVPQSRRRRP